VVLADLQFCTETGHQAVYCNHTAPDSPNRLTRAVTIVTAAAHHSYKHIHCIHQGRCAVGRFDLASTLTIDCHTGLCFHVRWYSTVRCPVVFICTQNSSKKFWSYLSKWSL